MATCSTDSAASDPVESPCIRLCTLDDDDICVGCYRSMAEICAWGGATNIERGEIVAQTVLRRKLRGKARTRRA